MQLKHAGVDNRVGSYYRPFQPNLFLSLAKITLLSMVLALVTGAAYGYISAIIPEQYFAMLSIVAFLFVISLLANKLVSVTQIKLVAISVPIGLVTGLIISYTGWVFWAYATYDQIIVLPKELCAVMEHLLKTGVWEGDEDVGSAMLIARWIVESSLLVVTTLGAYYWSTDDQPYCRTCERTVSQTFPIMNFAQPSQPLLFVNEIDSGKMDGLISQIGADSTHATGFYNICLQNCDVCKKQAYLTINAVQLNKNHQGKTERKEQTLIKQMKIDNASMHAIAEALEKRLAADG